MNNNTKIFKKIEAIALDEFACHTNLEMAVAQHIIDRYVIDHDIKMFLNDLAQNGCISGMVNGLIYYTDTAEFYDRHYHDIEALREELEDSLGEPLQPKGDLKNWYAWLAFEETARKIADEVGIEL